MDGKAGLSPSELRRFLQRFVPCPVPYPLPCALCSLSSVLCPLFSVLCFLSFVLYSLLSALCPLPCALCPLPFHAAHPTHGIVTLPTRNRRASAYRLGYSLKGNALLGVALIRAVVQAPTVLGPGLGAVR